MRSTALCRPLLLVILGLFAGLSPLTYAQAVTPQEQVQVQAWVDGKGFESSLKPIWDYAGEMYKSTCNSCHGAPDPAHFTANGWISGLKAMSAYYRLSKEEERTLLKYLQNHAADTGGQGSH